MDLTKMNLKFALNNHNNFVASDCKDAPCRDVALKYYTALGDLISAAGCVANLGELATELSRALAVMHYATMDDKDYTHPNPDLKYCKMDRSCFCPVAMWIKVRRILRCVTRWVCTITQ